jgi:membrane fusion protein, heavy metal efflux system
MKPPILHVLVFLLTLLSGCREKDPAAPSAASVTTTKPKAENDMISLPTNAPQLNSLSLETAAKRRGGNARFTGRLTWNDEVTVRVFSPVAGRVRSVSANLGQVLREGDVLATVASPEFGQTQADSLKAKADLLLAERTLKRVQELFEHGAAPRKDVDFAEDAFSTAQSEKQRADARLALYGGVSGAVDQWFPLKSPISGVLVEKNINNGQELRPDQMLANSPSLFAPLFVISNPKSLWLFLDVTEVDMSTFKAGMKLHLQTRAYPDRQFQGTIDFVGSSLDPATRTVRMRATVDNPEELLKAELYVSAEVAMVESNAAAEGVDIPSKAIFLQDNRPHVFVETGPGSFVRRSVKLGPENDGKIVAMSGVNPGERVVTQGCLLLQSMLESKE